MAAQASRHALSLDPSEALAGSVASLGVRVVVSGVSG